MALIQQVISLVKKTYIQQVPQASELFCLKLPRLLIRFFPLGILLSHGTTKSIYLCGKTSGVF